MNKYTEFKELVKKCIKLCNDKRSLIESGIEDECTIYVIDNTIMPEMEKFLAMQAGDELPPKSKRFCMSYAMAFKEWGWNMKTPSELFTALLEIDRAYKSM